MRIIDWSSDVCSSDLSRQRRAFIARSQTAEHYDVSSDLGCHAGIRTTHQFDGLRKAVQHRPGPGESHFIGTDKADQTILTDRLAARNAAIHKRHASRASELTDLLQTLKWNARAESDCEITHTLRPDPTRPLPEVTRLQLIHDSEQTNATPA